MKFIQRIKSPEKKLCVTWIRHLGLATRDKEEYETKVSSNNSFYA